MGMGLRRPHAPQRPQIDLLVAGGGPIGLVTALHAAQRGMRVVVLEPRAAPIDKACGEGLMPGAVGTLARLGIRPDGGSLRGIRYVATGGPSAVADFPRGARSIAGSGTATGRGHLSAASPSRRTTKASSR